MLTFSVLGSVIVILAAVAALLAVDHGELELLGLRLGLRAGLGGRHRSRHVHGRWGLGIGDAGHAQGECRRAGGKKGLTQGEAPPGGGCCWTGRARPVAPRRGLITTRQQAKGFAASVAGSMRADSPSISAPPFPRNLAWANVAMLRMDQQRDKVVLVEFWDFCRVNRRGPCHTRRPGMPGTRTRACASSACTPAGSSGALRRRTPAAPSSAGDPRPVAIDTTLEGAGHLRQRGLARVLPLGAVGDRAHPAFAARRRRRVRSRPSSRSSPCWAWSAIRSRRSGREEAADALVADPTPDQPGAYRVPTAAARRVRSSPRASAWCGPRAWTSRSPSGLLPAARALATPRVSSSWSSARASTVHAPTCFTLGLAGLSLRGPVRRAGGRGGAGLRPPRSPPCPASRASRRAPGRGSAAVDP